MGPVDDGGRVVGVKATFEGTEWLVVWILVWVGDSVSRDSLSPTKEGVALAWVAIGWKRLSMHRINDSFCDPRMATGLYIQRPLDVD